MEPLIQLDKRILKWAYQKPFNNTPLIKAMIFMGDAPFWMLVIVISALAGQFLNSTVFEQLAVALMLGLSIGNLIFSQLKIRVNRQRPYASQQLQKNLNITINNRDPGHGSKELESFPSGHVFWTTLCICLISFQLGWLGGILLGWMIPGMMFLRLHLGVHYPSDTLAGLLLGFCIASLTQLLTPILWEMLTILKSNPAYVIGYWLFIGVFLIMGIKAWSKRV